MLQKDGEDQLDWLCEKWSITKSHRGKEHPTQIKRWKADLIGHILCGNYLLEHVIEGKIEGMGRQGRRCTHLLDDIKVKRG
jgi:hypothetical protein